MSDQHDWLFWLRQNSFVWASSLGRPMSLAPACVLASPGRLHQCGPSCLWHLLMGATSMISCPGFAITASSGPFRQGDHHIFGTCSCVIGRPGFARVASPGPPHPSYLWHLLISDQIHRDICAIYLATVDNEDQQPKRNDGPTILLATVNNRNQLFLVWVYTCQNFSLVGSTQWHNSSSISMWTPPWLRHDG